MRTRQYFLTTLLLIWSFTCCAGSEDWKGLYNFKDTKGETHTVIHTPNTVSFMFLSSGSCIVLSKGSVLNDLEIKADVKLCTNNNVTDFTKEVEKLGLITNKNILIGSSYTEE